jgi:hypothetical protein
MLVFLAPSLARAVTLASFDFNTPDNNAATGTLASTTGMGTLATVGGATTFFGFGTGSTDPEVGANDSAWGLGDFPPQGTASGTVGFEVAVSTVGYNQVRIQFDQKNQPSSNKWYSILLPSAPSGPVDLEHTTYGVEEADVWYTWATPTSYPTVVNNPNFAFRVVAAFEPSTSQYVASEAGYNGQIPTLFDRIIVEGFVIPEPAALAMLVLALACLVIKHRAVRITSSR